MVTAGKLLVHFDSEWVSVHRFRNSELALLKRERPAFEESLAPGMLASSISEFCKHGLFIGNAPDQHLPMFVEVAQRIVDRIDHGP